MRWPRPWLAAVVAVLGLVTVATPFAEDMPVFHHVAVPAAVAVMLAAWAIEPSGRRWPRLLLVLGVVLPNIWLTLIGRVSSNYLFIILLVGWVGVVGTRGESAAALALALATLALGIGLDAMSGPIAWASWTSWLVGLLLAPEVEQELFRIAQEALNNVLKHAHATRHPPDRQRPPARAHACASMSRAEQRCARAQWFAAAAQKGCLSRMR